MDQMNTTKARREYLKQNGVAFDGDSRLKTVIDKEWNKYVLEVNNDILEWNNYMSDLDKYISENTVIAFSEKLNNIRTQLINYAEEIIIVLDSEAKETYIAILEMIRDEFQSGDKFMMTFPNGEMRTLSIIGLEKLLSDVLENDKEDMYYQQLLDKISFGYELKISKIDPYTSNRVSRVGGYLSVLMNSETNIYLTKHGIDITRYQIFENFNAEDYRYGCLTYALLHYKLDESVINKLIDMSTQRIIPTLRLGAIANRLGITIKLHSCSKDKTDVVSYGSSDIICDICFFENHYFVYDKFPPLKIGEYIVKSSIGLVKALYSNKSEYFIDMTSSELNKIKFEKQDLSLEFDMKEIEEYNNKYLSRYRFMDEENFDESMDRIYTNKYKYFSSKTSQNPLEQPLKKKKENKMQGKWFIDFECYISKNNVHVPYQLGYIESEMDASKFRCINGLTREVFTKSMLDDICSKSQFIPSKKDEKEKDYGIILLLAHNAKYDSCFFDFNILNRLKILKKSGAFYSMSFEYSYKKRYYAFMLVDTYKHLSNPLSDFGKMFKLPVKKEVIPYNIYSEDVVAKRNASISESIKSLWKYYSGCNQSIIDQFTNNIDEWKLKRSDDVYDAIMYSQFYNKLDVLILRDAYNSWQSSVLEFTGLDIYGILTTASLSQAYMENAGAYNGVCRINQSVREFINETAYGGKCTSNREQKFNVNERIVDYDGCSLYPSAIYRLKEYGGILKGEPKLITCVIEDNDMKFLNSVDGYFIEIIINSLKDSAFPQIPVLINGSYRYSTDLLIGRKIKIGKIQLEDLITFSDLKFTFVRGVYFNCGRNSIMCDKISQLYTQRAIYKKTGSSLQNIVKLLMNSAYGKSLIKPNNSTSEVIMNVDIINEKGEIENEYKKKIYSHFSNIKSIKQMGTSNKYLFEYFEAIENHFSCPHVGSEILAMSKRITNEVFFLAEENNIFIFATDTDSIHMYEKDVSKLINLFREKYGRELDGKDLGQFHSDFSSNEISGELVSIHFIYLGKKSYLDKLTNDKGEIAYHVRMKGIPKTSIDTYCLINNINVEELYEKMYSGESIKFDLTSNGQKPKFLIRNFTCETKLIFNRMVKF